MTTENINISASNIKGKCDSKCSYAFKYSESNSTAKNNGVLINLTYDSTSIPPVIYNNQKYFVENIVIVSPSIHTFDDNSLPGEIIITHNPQNGGNNLKVSIPFTTSSDSSTSSQIITDIIKKIATNAPSEGDSTNLNMSFSLQKIVPRKPFFAYSGKRENTDWIVYGKLDAIPLTSTTISTLQEIIRPFPIPTPGGDLFYNSKGPRSGIQLGDGIYISCQPTGSSEEETAVEYDKNSSSSIDFSNIIESPIFKFIFIIIIGCLLFSIIFYGISAFYDFLSSDAKKMPGVTSLPKLSGFPSLPKLPGLPKTS
jgi:carbonic anhydrase